MKEKYHKWIMAIFAAVIAFFAGYSLGMYSLADFGVRHFFNYLDYRNITLPFERQEIYNYFWKAFSLLK